MVSRVHSAQSSGLDARGVIVETDISRGLYLFQIVGLADRAVEESRERVIAALRNNLGINPKARHEKVTVSLSPAEVRKEGSYFDLAIAIGYVLASELYDFSQDEILITEKAFVGELALNGDVLPVRGMLAIAQWAIEHGIKALYVPAANATEASLIDGLTIYLVPTLGDLIGHLRGTDHAVMISRFAPPHRSREGQGEKRGKEKDTINFSDIKGQESAKRALCIAASGGHNIVLYGPPGTGKTMLARACRSILPPLSTDAFLAVARIYSSIGLIDDVLDGLPPIRAPHHSASYAAVIGGSAGVRPGEITLAHQGLLYLDEFPEFDRRVIEALREPLEEGCITVSRAKSSQRFPARFMLLAAMNPCPCGYRGSTVRTCTCSGADLARYSRKLSGPIMDRIDIWVPVSNIEYESLHEKKEQESDATASQVSDARLLQMKRCKKLNSELAAHELQTDHTLTDDAKLQLQQYATRLKLSPRAYLRTIKVARTIADLAQSRMIETDHMLEALQYRQRAD